MLYAVFRGRHPGSLVDVVSAIQAYRSLVQARESIGRPGFIATRLTKRIRQVCDHARAYQRVAMMFGDGPIGKSKNLEEYAHHGEHALPAFAQRSSLAPDHRTAWPRLLSEREPARQDRHPGGDHRAL